MTKQDFDLILIESLGHETRQSYFKGKREEFKCDVDEYRAGLVESFERLFKEVNQPDYEYCEITFPDGKIKKYSGFEQGRVRAMFRDDQEEEYQYPIDECKIVYPLLRTRFEYLGHNFTLSPLIMAVIWGDLYKYIKSVAPVEPQREKSDHSALLTALSNHVTGISADEFTNIVEYHSLTPGTPKAKWTGKKAEASYFAKAFNITMPEFEKCFYFEDGKKLGDNYRPTKNEFTDLIKPFIK
jgi:hypothetical protein